MSYQKKIDNTKTSDIIIDLKGLNSPLPLLRIKKELEKMESKQILQANCTDPGCRNDFPGWCDRMGHKYLGENTDFDFISYYIQKK